MYPTTGMPSKEFIKVMCLAIFILKPIQLIYSCESMNVRAAVRGMHHLYWRESLVGAALSPGAVYDRDFRGVFRSPRIIQAYQ